MKPLRKLLGSKVAVILLALATVGLVMVGCSGDTTGGQAAQPTGQPASPTVVEGVASPDITTPVTAPPAAAITGSISGTVVDSFSRAPVQGATVSVSVGATSAVSSTGADGHFSLTGIPLTESETTAQPQPIQITITGATGYPSPSFWATTLQRSSSDTVNSALASTAIIELHGTTGTVTGTFIDPVNGNPLSGVIVDLTPNPLNVEISGGAFVRVDQPFGGLTTTSTADGRFTLNNVPVDHDYVIDISDPQARIQSLRLGTPFVATAAGAALGTGVLVPGPGAVVNLDAGAVPLAGGGTVLVGGLAVALVPNPQEGGGADPFNPFVTGAAIGNAAGTGVTAVSQGQDISTTLLTDLNSANGNIRIHFSEAMNPSAGIAGIQLLDLGPKGTTVATGVRVPAAVQYDSTEVAAGNARTLLIKPQAALVQGERYVVTGLGGLQDRGGRSYGGNQTVAGFACPGAAGYPQCDRGGTPDYLNGGIADVNLDGDGGNAGDANEAGVFFFTTNTGTTPNAAGAPLALAAAPTVTGKRNNLINDARAFPATLPGSGLGSRSVATFVINWTPVTGASAYNVCVIPDSGSGNTACVPIPSNAQAIFTTAGTTPNRPSIPFTAGTPAARFRVTMDQIQAVLALTPPQSLPPIISDTDGGVFGFPNTILDDNLRLQFKVSVFDRNGVEGPQSAAATDTVLPGTVINLGDNTAPTLNEDVNFNGSVSASEDLDGDGAVDADPAVGNYLLVPGIPAPTSSSPIPVYDVGVSWLGTTATVPVLLANRIPFNNLGSVVTSTGALGVFTTSAPLRLLFNEDIDLASATTSTVGPIATGTTPIGGNATFTTEPSVTVALNDNDGDPTTGTNGRRVDVTTSNIFIISTGDTLPVSVKDEAANAFTATLTLLDTLSPFVTTIATANNGAGADNMVITFSEPLLASSVVGTAAVGNPGCTATFFFSPAPAGPFPNPLPCTTTIGGANVVTLSADARTVTITIPDGAVFAGNTFTTANGFTAASVLAVAGISDQAENVNAVINPPNPNTANAIGCVATVAPATCGFTIGTIAP